MNKFFKRLHSATATTTASSNIKILSVKECLGLEGEQSYFEPNDLVTYAQSLREVEIEQLEQGFDCMQKGLRNIGSIVTRTDKGGRSYAYINFVKLNATVGIKFILESGMKKFILDYQDGKFRPGFSLEELVEEAINI